MKSWHGVSGGDCFRPCLARYPFVSWHLAICFVYLSAVLNVFVRSVWRYISRSSTSCCLLACSALPQHVTPSAFNSQLSHPMVTRSSLGSARIICGMPYRTVCNDVQILRLRLRALSKLENDVCTCDVYSILHIIVSSSFPPSPSLCPCILHHRRPSGRPYLECPRR